MKDFHEPKVWQKAHQLTLTVYQITATFPGEELYGLTAQLRRSCSSIPANLVEGCGRQWRCRVHPLQPASVPLRWDRLANSSITCCWPEILKLIKLPDYEQLAQRTIVVKRMADCA